MAQLELRRHNSTVLAELSKGDLVEFPRGYYSHWGVYKGDEEIVHLAGDDNDGINANVNSGHVFTICGKGFNKACVKVDNFWDVAGSSRVKKNNNKDKKSKPFDPDEIIERALSKLGAIPYNVLWNNCEHFAAWCRNGENWSQQAETFLKWVMAGAAGVVVGGLALAVAGSDSKKKEKEQS